jgi:hypothetical protein
MPPLHSIMQLGQASGSKKRKLVEESPVRKRDGSKGRHEERDRKRQGTNRVTKELPKSRKKSRTGTKS